MKLENWNTFFQVASAVLLGLTFAIGTGAVVTGYFLGKRQDERIATTERGTAEAKIELAKQQERAARAEQDLLELQQRLAWRMIPPQGRDEFVALLKPFAGSVVLVSGFDNADIESKTFARDISKGLKDVQWNASLDLTNTFSNLPVGISCKCDLRSPAGKALAEALKVLPDMVIIPTQFTDRIGVITVGMKPPP